MIIHVNDKYTAAKYATYIEHDSVDVITIISRNVGSMSFIYKVTDNTIIIVLSTKIPSGLLWPVF